LLEARLTQSVEHESS